MTKGSCLCGKVQFEIEGEFEQFFLCHCQYCRKDTGSAHAANLFSTTARLNWIYGQDLVRTYRLPSTQHSKSFCTNCGSAVASMQMQGKLLVTPAGSLDDPITKVPDAHLFIASKAGWDNELDKVKKLDKLPA